MSRKSLAWSAAALLLMLSLVTPLNFLTIFLIMTPFVVLYTMLKPKFFVLHLILIGVIAYFLSGVHGPIMLTLAFFFLVPSLAMGHAYKRGSTARLAIMVGFAFVLAQLLLELVLFSMLYHIDLKAEMISMLTTNLKQFETGNAFPAGWSLDTANAFGDAIMTMLPMLLLLSSFFFTIVTHALSRLSLRTVGIQAPALPQAKTWRMPRSLVWYYVIAIIASFAMQNDNNSNSSDYWSIVVLNLMPTLEFVFTVQTIGFFFFLADAKKWPKVVPLLLCIPLLLIPRFFIIGLLDVAFPLRKYFVK
jgi:uncharacterized protein YybS (DUF2232 family)